MHLNGFNLIDSPPSQSKEFYFCPKLDHDECKVSLICMYKNCTKPRLGCAFCFLEDHKEHLSSKLKIKNFDIGLKEKISDIFNYYENLGKVNEENIIKDEINKKFNEVKYQFDSFFDNFKETFIKIYEKKLIKIKEKMFHDENLKENLNNLSKKNVFEMDNNDLEISIKLLLNKNIEKYHDLFHINNNKFIVLKQNVNKYLSKIKSDLEISLNTLLEENKIKNSFKNSEKLNSIDPKKINSKILKATTILKQNNDNLDSNFKNLQLNLSLSNFKLEDTNNNNRVSQKKLSKRFCYDNLLHKNAKLIYKQFLNPICDHLKKPVKRVIIFECCNKAYLCIKCHDEENNHKWHQKDNPFLCYCLKCYTIGKFANEKCKNCLIGLHN